VVAFGGLVIGTVIAQFDTLKSGSVTDKFPFMGWAATAIVGLWVMIDKDVLEWDEWSNNRQWLLTLYTAAHTGKGGHGDTSKLLLQIGCVGGVVFSVLELVGPNERAKVKYTVLALTQAVLFVPLCWDLVKSTTDNFDLDTIWRQIAAYTFAVILGVRAVLCLLYVFSDRVWSRDGATRKYVWIFVLCLVLQINLGQGGESTSFKDLAGKMAQVGPAMGLVALILDLLDARGQLVSTLRSVAELVIIIGILLA